MAPQRRRPVDADEESSMGDDVLSLRPNPNQRKLGACERLFVAPKRAVVLEHSSLFVFSGTNRFRIFVYNIVRHAAFEGVSIAVIVANSVLLALNDPTTKDDPMYQTVAEYIFTALFTLEMVVKVIALGFVGHEGAYLRSSWNMLDCFIVILSYLSLLPNVDNYSGARAVRVLRPLRSMNAVPGLRAIVQCLLHSIRGLVNVILLLSLLFSIFGILGVQLWKGRLKLTCFDTATNVSFPDLHCKYGGNETVGSTFFGSKCPLPTMECRTGVAPFSGLLGFDNVPSAALLLFTVITFESWTTYLTMLYDCFGQLAFFYFFVFIVLGAYFVPNLSLAVINEKFIEERAKLLEKEEEERRAAALEARTSIVERSNLRLPSVSMVVEMGPRERLLSLSDDNVLPVRDEGHNNNNSHNHNIGAGDAAEQDEQRRPGASAVVAVDEAGAVALAGADAERHQQQELDTHQESEVPVRHQSHSAQCWALWERLRDHVHHFTEGYPRAWEDDADASAGAGLDNEEDAGVLGNDASHGVAGDLVLSLDEVEERRRLRENADMTLFTKFIVFCIVANTTILASQHYQQPDWVGDMGDAGNKVLTAIFAAEVALKLTGMGFRNYFIEPFNSVDSIVVLISIIELSLSGSSTVSVFRALRLLRVLKLLKNLDSLRKIVRIMLAAVKSTGYLNVIMLLYLFIAALLGMQIFGGQFGKLTTPTYEPRTTFDSFYKSFLAVFQILTRDAWSEVMINGANATHPVAVLYFVALVLIGDFLILNLFLAIFIGAFEDDDANEEDTEVASLTGVGDGSASVKPASYAVDATSFKREKALQMSREAFPMETTASYFTRPEEVIRIGQAMKRQLARMERLNNQSSLFGFKAPVVLCNAPHADAAAAAADSAVAALFPTESDENGGEAGVRLLTGPSAASGSMRGLRSQREVLPVPRVLVSKSSDSAAPVSGQKTESVETTNGANKSGVAAEQEDGSKTEPTVTSNGHGDQQINKAVCESANVSRSVSEDNVEAPGFVPTANASTGRDHLLGGNNNATRESPPLPGEHASPPLARIPSRAKIELGSIADDINFLATGARRSSLPFGVSGGGAGGGDENANSGLHGHFFAAHTGDGEHEQVHALHHARRASVAFSASGASGSENSRSQHLGAYRTGKKRRSVEILTHGDPDDVPDMSEARMAMVLAGNDGTKICPYCGSALVVPLISAPLVRQVTAEELHQRVCDLIQIRRSKERVLRQLADCCRDEIRLKDRPTSDKLETIIGQAWSCGLLLGDSWEALTSCAAPWTAILDALMEEERVLEMCVGEEQVGRSLIAYSAANVPRTHRTNGSYSLFLLGPTNPVRVFFSQLILEPWFDRIVLAFIIVSSLLLAVDNPRDNQTSDLYEALNILDIIFTAVFALEMVMKIIALGFVLHDGAYLRDPWNGLDSVIVLLSFVSLAVEGVDISYLKVFRSLRALRPLRVITRNRGLKMVVQTLFHSVKGISNVGLISLLNYLIWGILGVQLFGGKLYSCNDPTMTTRQACVGSFSPIISPALGGGNGTNTTRLWLPYTRNFDNIGASMLTLLEVSALEWWVPVMYDAIDAVGEDQAPQLNANPVVGLFFIGFIIIASFFLLSMFVGVVISSFNNVKAQMDGLSFLTAEQKLWVDTQRLMLNFRPRVRMIHADTKLSYAAYRIVLHEYFEPLIAVLIVSNVVVLALDYDGASDDYLKTLAILGDVFAVAFTIEAALKITAYRTRYFYDGWERLNMFLVILGLIGLALRQLSESTGEVPLNPGVLYVFRLFRVLRLLRLFKQAQQVRVLLLTLWYSLPSLANIGGFLGLLYFMYGVLGVQLFYNIERGALIDSKSTNFWNFWNSIGVLFRVMTVTDWNSAMHDCMVQPPQCNAKAGECGTYAAPFFFISFMLLSSFVLTNLFIAIILDNFNTTTQMEKSNVEMSQLQRFVELWADFDDMATMRMETFRLPFLLSQLRPPLGITYIDDKMEVLQRLRKLRVPEHGGYIHFVETLIPLARGSMGVKHSDREIREHEQLWRQHFPTLDDEPVLRYRQSVVTVDLYFSSTYIQAAYRRTVARRLCHRLRAQRRETIAEFLRREKRPGEAGAGEVAFQSVTSREDSGRCTAVEMSPAPTYDANVENPLMLNPRGSVSTAVVGPPSPTTGLATTPRRLSSVAGEQPRNPLVAPSFVSPSSSVSHGLPTAPSGTAPPGSDGALPAADSTEAGVSGQVAES